MFVDGHRKPKVGSDGEVLALAICRQDWEGKLLLVRGGRRGGLSVFTSQIQPKRRRIPYDSLIVHVLTWFFFSHQTCYTWFFSYNIGEEEQI